MKTDYVKPNLTNVFFKAIEDYKNNYFISFNTDKIIEEYNKYKSLIKEYELLLEDNINDEVYMYFLHDIVNIKLEHKDYIKIMSKKNNIDYKKIEVLNTHTFANRKIPTRICYLCIMSNKVDNNHHYTNSEINDLINSKDIILINKIYETCYEYKFDFKEEKDFKIIDLDSFMDKNSDMYPYTVEYLKSKINKDILLKEYNKFINKLNEEVDYITNFNTEGKSENISKELVLKLK